MHAYAAGPDLDALIARAHGGRPITDQYGCFCWITNCWLPVRRAKPTNCADRWSIARVDSGRSRFAHRPAPPPRSSRHFETPTEGTRWNSWA